MPRTILVVDSDPESLASTADTLTAHRYVVSCAATFEEAKRRLALVEPDVLIADVRLGAFNGIHLALRMRTLHLHTATIITDRSHDPVLAGEAAREGALYLPKPFSASDLLNAVERACMGRDWHGPTRRWPRKQPPAGAIARIAEAQAKLVDVSYGGIGFELAADPGDALARPTVRVELPALDLSLTVSPVWTRQSPAKTWTAGAQLVDVDAPSDAAWRGYVDSLN